MVDLAPSPLFAFLTTLTMRLITLGCGHAAGTMGPHRCNKRRRPL